MRTKWFSIGCFVSFIILILLIIGGIAGLTKMSNKYSTQQTASIENGSYLNIKINGAIIEYNEYEESFFNKQVTDAHTITQKIKTAANDERIIGILLEPQMVSSGFAVINEIAESLEIFKNSGKPVIAFLERGGNKDYLLASEADKIYMNPSSSAGLFLSGVGSSVLFYKELFDKVGIDINVISAGKYKGAGETYSRNGFSPFVKENLHTLFGDIYSLMTKTIAENRLMAIEKVEYVYEERDKALINGQYGIELGLIDELVFREDLIKNLFLDDDKLVSIKKYKSKSPKVFSGNKIAVLYLQGGITEVRGQYNNPVINFEKVADSIDKIEKDDNIQAVVIRVNSPGGSALESEIIYNRIKKLQQSKAIIISMSNVAASGGYYISMSSDYIMADPFTITGSIGVVAMFPNFSKAADKYGINSDDASIGKYNDFLNPFVAPNEDFSTSIKQSINETYIEFKQRVATGRDLSLKEVEKHAQGQVWSTSQAIARNLVDGEGDLSAAIEKAAELSNTISYNVVYYPQQKDLLSEILKEQFDIETNIAGRLMKKADKFELMRIQDDLNRISADPIQTIFPYIGDEFNNIH